MGPRGGGDAEADALLTHVESAPQPSIQRVAARGVVAVIRSGRCQRPENALRRCLVGTPPACVDETCGACAQLVAAGVFDADAMCGELLAALAASHAAATADGASTQTRRDERRRAGALVRGIANVVAYSTADLHADSTDHQGRRTHRTNPTRSRLAEWVGPRHPLSRALRAHPTGAPPAVLAAISAILGHGPDSAAALAGAPARLAFQSLRPFLRHALLSDDKAVGAGFRSALHARLVRTACGSSLELSAPVAILLAGCLPWYRTQGHPGLTDQSESSAWVAGAAADVADALESAARRSFPGGTNDTSSIRGIAYASLEAMFGVVNITRECVGRGECVTSLLGALRRMLGLVTGDSAGTPSEDTPLVRCVVSSVKGRNALRSMACDLAECCDDAVRGAGADAGAIAALLGEFASVSGVLGGGTCARAVVGARVSEAMSLARERGGALATSLVTPRTMRVENVKDGTQEIEGGCGGGSSMDSALVDILHRDWRTGGSGVDACTDAWTLAVLDADTAADLAAVKAEAERRRRRRRNLGNDGGDFTAADSSRTAPPLLPLVLVSHPNPRVRERAAAALGERMAAVPDRAPSSLPPTLLAIKALSRRSENKNETAAVQRKASARAALAALRAATAGAAHPLGAPVALRALSPLVQPIPDDSLTNSKGDDSDSALKLGFTADAKAPDPKAHALALTLLADLWRHHAGSFPRLRAALEHAATSRDPAVVIGAAAATMRCAQSDPHGACDLVGPLRSFLDPKAPPVARALALESVRLMCDADALDFYAAFRVVVARLGDGAPADVIVRTEWARLLGAGWLDADARPDAAAAVAGAAWKCARVGLGLGFSGPGDEGTRAAAYEALGRFDPKVLVEPPAKDEKDEKDDETLACTPAPVPAGELAIAYLTDPASSTSATVSAAAKVVEGVARLERGRMARSHLAPGGFLRPETSDETSKNDAKVRREKGHAAASNDPLLHRLLNTTPRRLRTMPRLDGASKGGGGGNVQERYGPAGAGAHLFLFRPAPRADDGDHVVDARRRATEVNAELRARAEAHRRAFASCAAEIREPPRSHWWHGQTFLKSWHRFIRRWLRAEVAAFANVAESDSVASEEAVASVTAVLFKTLADPNATPDARSNAALAMSSPALLDFANGVSSKTAENGSNHDVKGTTESVTDAIHEGLTSGSMVGAERRAFLAYAAAVSRCHAADKPRRESCAQFLLNELTTSSVTGPAWSGRTAGAAAEALGMFLLGLGRDVETHGPGAGAWRTEMLSSYRDSLSNSAFKFEVSDDVQDAEAHALFRVGAMHGEAFAAAGADFAHGGFGHVVGHMRHLENILRSGDAGYSQAEIAGAAAAAPTAAALALASNAPVDRHVTDTLRLIVSLAATPGERSSVWLNSLASCGALLDVALAAGCSTDRRLATQTIDALTDVLLHTSGGHTPPSAPHGETAHTAAALGLAACVGGTWILPTVDTIIANYGLSGAGGGRARDTSTEHLSAPLVWGGEEGGRLAKRALSALEAASSAEGTAAAAATGGKGAVGIRAREVAAWGLAVAADRCAARASAWAASSASAPASASSLKGPSTGTGSNGVGGAIGALVTAATAGDTSSIAATRALRTLSTLDRLPAGDWPGALRRLTRRGDVDLVDACVALAVAHPGPSVGGGLLESLLGEQPTDAEAFDEFGMAEVTQMDPIIKPPPPRVLASLGECVAALPRAAAAAALRRCAASVASAVSALGETHEKEKDDEEMKSTIDAVAAAWRGLASAGSRLPRGPWTEDEIADACAQLCGAIARPGGPELDAAVEALSPNGGAPIGAARSCALAADTSAHSFAANSLRARLAVAGSIPRGDVKPLATWMPLGELTRLGRCMATHLCAVGKHLAIPPRWLRGRWLEESVGLDDGLVTLAWLCGAWSGLIVVGGHEGASGLDDDDVVRCLPATLPVAFGVEEGSGRGGGGEKVAVALAAIAGGTKESPVTREAAVRAVRGVREMLPGDTWERHAWRIESPDTAERTD